MSMDLQLSFCVKLGCNLPRSHSPPTQITLTGSIYSTLAITIERYITVCHPFYAVSHKWSARRYLVPIISFSLFYNAPKFFELSTAREENVNSTTNNYTIEPTAMRVNEIYIKVRNNKHTLYAKFKLGSSYFRSTASG